MMDCNTLDPILDSHPNYDTFSNTESAKQLMLTTDHQPRKSSKLWTDDNS